MRSRSSSSGKILPRVLILLWLCGEGIVAAWNTGPPSPRRRVASTNFGSPTARTTGQRLLLFPTADAAALNVVDVGHRHHHYAHRTPARRNLQRQTVGAQLLAAADDDNVTTITTETSTKDAVAQEQPQQPQPQKSHQKQPLNPFLSTIQPSATVALFSLVKQMESTGESVTSLCVGEPDFDPPPCVAAAVTQAIAATTHGGQTKYTAVTGTLALRTAIAADLALRKHVVYQPTTEIVVGSGAKPCVYQALLALAGVGDAVIVPSPYWPSYPEQVRLTGATPILVETDAAAGYRLTPDQLRSALRRHAATAKVLILCHPSNPTGSVYSRQDLEALCEVLQDYPAVSVVADEIYERLVYDSIEHVSVASLPNMWHRTVTINGVSKSHAMTGYRIGYAAAPAHICTAMATVQSQLSSCASSVSQAAAVAALSDTPAEWMEAVVSTMQTKRDFVLHRLAMMPGVEIKVPPTGAFYALPDVSAYCQKAENTNSDTENGNDDESGDEGFLYETDSALCMALLRQERLAVVPGSSFGAPGTIRLSYATDMDTLGTALDKLESFLAKSAVRNTT